MQYLFLLLYSYLIFFTIDNILGMCNGVMHRTLNSFIMVIITDVVSYASQQQSKPVHYSIIICDRICKSGQHCMSLNLQHKALNTLGAYWRIVKKIP